LPLRHPRPPSASYGFPRAHRLAPLTPAPTPHAAIAAGDGRWEGRCAWRFCLGLFEVKDLAGPPKPAARAAFFGVWAAGRRGGAREKITTRIQPPPRAAHLYHPANEGGCLIKRLSARAQASTDDVPEPRMPICRRPGGSNSAGPARLVPDHGSNSASSQDIGSSLSWPSWLRATSMRPRESEGSCRRQQRR